jgi:hypothetical protein
MPIQFLETSQRLHVLLKTLSSSAGFESDQGSSIAQPNPQGECSCSHPGRSDGSGQESVFKTFYGQPANDTSTKPIMPISRDKDIDPIPDRSRHQAEDVHQLPGKGKETQNQQNSR